jgi:hypothetical protein
MRPIKAPRRSSAAAESATRFLNVDVDAWSESKLQPLVAAFGKRILVHYVGAERRQQSAHFALASAHGKDADAIIRRLVALIEALPRPARQLWNRARRRDFNIGIQAGIEPYCHELALQNATLALVAGVGGRIVVTTYGSGTSPIRKNQSRR